MQPILPPLGHNILVFSSFFAAFIATLIIPIFMIPLQVKQAGVQNGLNKLRKQLLLKGLISFITAGIASYFIFLISVRVSQTDIIVPTITQLLLFIFSFSKLANAVLDYQIYHQQYSPEHVQVSNQIANLMERQNMKKQRPSKLKSST